MSIFTRTWVYDAGERAVKTAAQFVLGAWGVAVIDPGGSTVNLDWALGAQSALSGAVLSILFSIVSGPIGGNGTASVISAPPGPVATEG